MWAFTEYTAPVGANSAAGGPCLTAGGKLHGSALLQQVNLPTLSWRRRIHCLVLLFKLYRGLGPPQLLSRLPKPASVRSAYSLRAAHRLEFPSSSSARHLSSFLCVTIPVWNSLPGHVVSSISVNSFVFGLHRVFAYDRFSFGL